MIWVKSKIAFITLISDVCEFSWGWKKMIWREDIFSYFCLFLMQRKLGIIA